MDLAQQLALYADRLRDIAAFGLQYSENLYEQARFQSIQAIAGELFALAAQKPPDQFEPIDAAILLHPTPFAVGDGAVVDAHGRMLLVRRADNMRWAMPGGALEVGETPAAGVEREVLEETGVLCRATALVGIFDSRHCGTRSRHHLYQVVFLCTPLAMEGLGQGSHGHEVLDVAWFAEDALPPEIDPGHVSRIPEAFRTWRGEGSAFFDLTLPG